jgi:hypothetical protein
MGTKILPQAINFIDEYIDSASVNNNREKMLIWGQG